MVREGAQRFLWNQWHLITRKQSKILQKIERFLFAAASLGYDTPLS